MVEWGDRGGEREVLRWRNMDGWRRVGGGGLRKGGRVGEAQRGGLRGREVQMGGEGLGATSAEPG